MFGLQWKAEATQARLFGECLDPTAFFGPIFRPLFRCCRLALHASWKLGLRAFYHEIGSWRSRKAASNLDLKYKGKPNTPTPRCSNQKRWTKEPLVSTVATPNLADCQLPLHSRVTLETSTTRLFSYYNQLPCRLLPLPLHTPTHYHLQYVYLLQ